MQRERWWGTLELLVAAPRHFALVLLPATLGLATVGIYNLVATLLWGRLLFGSGKAGQRAEQRGFQLARASTATALGSCRQVVTAAAVVTGAGLVLASSTPL